MFDARGNGTGFADGRVFAKKQRLRKEPILSASLGFLWIFFGIS